MTSQNDFRSLRVAAAIEGTTLLLLLIVAVPLRHLAGWRVATAVMGPIHGLAFLAFVWFAIGALAEGRFGRREGAIMLIVACLPFGGFLTARWLARRAAAQ